MSSISSSLELPLLYKTPDHWVKTALSDVFSLLSDHAYLERKAASNALDLLNRWPEPNRPETWEATLTAIARDEALHLHQVIRVLQARGGRLERLHRSSYASDLRDLVRQGKGPHETLDRLLVSSLIEARSCERFEMLGRLCEDPELKNLYKGLWASEAGHFAVFLKLAEDVVPLAEAQARFHDMLQAEARIIQMQPLGPKLHSRAG